MGLDVYSTVWPTRNLCARSTGVRSAIGEERLSKNVHGTLRARVFPKLAAKPPYAHWVRLTFAGRLFTEGLFIEPTIASNSSSEQKI